MLWFFAEAHARHPGITGSIVDPCGAWVYEAPLLLKWWAELPSFASSAR